jgi:hypothetical protein
MRLDEAENERRLLSLREGDTDNGQNDKKQRGIDLGKKQKKEEGGKGKEREQ